MKRIVFVMLVLVGLCLLANGAQAQSPTKVSPASSATPPEPPQSPPSGWPRGPGVRGLYAPVSAEALDKALGQLNLSDDQKAAITKIRADFEPKIKDDQPKLDELKGQMLAAIRAGDQEMFEDISKQMKVLGDPQAERMVAITKELKPEQVAKLEELLTPPMPVRVVVRAATENADALKLTEDEKTAIKALIDKLAAQTKQSGLGPGIEYLTKIQQMRQNGASDAEIQKAQDEGNKQIEAWQAKLAEEDAANRAEFEKILTKEQFVQIKEIVAKMNRAFRDGLGFPRGPGGGRHVGPDAPPSPAAGTNVAPHPSGGPNAAPPPGGPAGGN